MSSLSPLAGNLVLTLHQAARIVPRRHMAQPNVARHTAKQRNSLSNEDRHARDNQPLNSPRAQKPLNGHAAIDVQVLNPAGDRKSTRLNSSHRTISYAVFCLKKKKNKKN